MNEWGERANEWREQANEWADKWADKWADEWAEQVSGANEWPERAKDWAERRDKWAEQEFPFSVFILLLYDTIFYQVMGFWYHRHIAVSLEKKHLIVRVVRFYNCMIGYPQSLSPLMLFYNSVKKDEMSSKIKTLDWWYGSHRWKRSLTECIISPWIWRWVGMGANEYRMIWGTVYLVVVD